MRTRLSPSSDHYSAGDVWWRTAQRLGWRWRWMGRGRWRLGRRWGRWWWFWRIRWWRRVRWWRRWVELVGGRGKREREARTQEDSDYDETRRIGEAASARIRRWAALGGALRLGGGGRAQSEE